MTAQECAEQIVSKIAPRLSELGVEAFCFAAYLRVTNEKGDEEIQRYVIVNGGNNPPMQDGLLPVVVAASQWNRAGKTG